MHADRRRFFRINDSLGLKTSTINPKEEQQCIEDFHRNQHEYSIRNEFNFQLAQHQVDLHSIEKKMPELARYLTVMQLQIDRLIEQILPEQNAFLNDHKDVNLSAQGISYVTQDHVTIGSLQQLHLELQPSKQQLIILARVVKCQTINSSTAASFLISLDFEHIHEADQEILVKHVHSKQLQQLGEAQHNLLE